MSVNVIREITLPVANTTVINKNRFITINTAGLAQHAGDPLDTTFTGGYALGVSTSTHPDNTATTTTKQVANEISVAVLDGSMVEIEAGNAISVGASLTEDYLGRAIAASAAGQHILGVAMEAASAAGQKIKMITSQAGERQS